MTVLKFLYDLISHFKNGLTYTITKNVILPIEFQIIYITNVINMS